MSDTTPAPALPAAPEAVNLLETDAVLVALAHPLRHRLVCSLAHNNRASVNSLAERLREPPDVISKHLRILREARLLRAVAIPGEDGRRHFYEVSALFRSQDTAGNLVLDFGAVLVRVEAPRR